MKLRKVFSGVFVAMALSAVLVAAGLGLSVLYVLAGVALLFAVLVFARSFAKTAGKRWALSSVALVVLAALVVTPILIHSPDNPTVAFAPDEDSGWIPDGNGGGYAVNTRTITHLDDTGEVEWEHSAEIGTWSVDDGLLTGDSDRLVRITADGETAWERTASDFGEKDVSPVARHEGITTVSACTSVFESGEITDCKFVGIDDSGVETYTIEAKLAATVTPGGPGQWTFANLSGFGVTGSLPSHFGHGTAEDLIVSVADAADGKVVTTVAASSDDVSPVAFAADGVFISEQSGDTCTMSRVPLAGDPGWTAKVPCHSFGGNSYNYASFNTGILDGNVLWLRGNESESDETSHLDAVAIDLATGDTQEAGKVLWEDLPKSAADLALVNNGRLLEIRDSTLELRDPFSDVTTWSAHLDGGFRYLVASQKVAAVLTRPERPRLFSSVEEWTLCVYALDNGRLLGRETFDPDEANNVFPLENAVLLTFDDGRSIRVG